MTEIDVTPAQAARQADVERVARAIHAESELDFDLPNRWTWEQAGDVAHGFYRRLAVAAIDVIRGAADDGAIGRVLRLADELAHPAGTAILLDPEQQALRDARFAALRHAAGRIRAAVGAPATTEGDEA